MRWLVLPVGLTYWGLSYLGVSLYVTVVVCFHCGLRHPIARREIPYLAPEAEG